MTQTSNPLAQFFRQPALYLQLPSQGQYWPPNSLLMPANQELPILPMTAIDEIAYRTPDALFNGSAIASVIKSCVPAVQDPWAAPAMDINAMLIAIRIASFGRELEVESQCPSCGTAGEYSCDLHSVLGQLRTPNYSEHIDQGELQIYFHPLNYKLQNDIGMQQFEHQRVLAQLPQSELPEDQKIQMVKDAMVNISNLTTMAMATSVAAIKTPTALVNDPKYIKEFLENCDRKIYNAIKDHVITLREQADIPPMPIVCSNCQHSYSQAITLDQTNFFETAS